MHDQSFNKISIKQRVSFYWLRATYILTRLCIKTIAVGMSYFL